jgi:hypothetical protein
MPKKGKEADVIHPDACCIPASRPREGAESGINVYVNDP